ncbi:MAG: choice-of-anchor D domain-containing protein, partial [Terriglobales bacterium]
MRSFPLFIVAGLLFCLVPDSARAQRLDCSPCSYNFGNVTVGQSASYSIQLTNVGTQTLTISSKSISGSGFSYGNLPLPIQIDAHSSIAVPIVFKPTVEGSTAGVLTLISNAQNSPLEADVSGVGTGNAPSGDLKISPAKLSFGDVTVGSTASLKATLTASNAPVTISSDRSTSPEFDVLGLQLPVTIPAGKS